VRVFSADEFTFPLPTGHRLSLIMYTLLREAVVTTGLILPEDLLVPEAATDEQILRAHDADYLERVSHGRLSPEEQRRIGLPWSPQLAVRARRSIGGTIAACRAALKDGIAVNLAGGTHHAFCNRGQGYCLFNDSVIAARTMQAEDRVQRVVILDCDVHQGNGTAAITAADPTIFAFSIHCQDNFPLHKEQGDLDIGLEDGTSDGEYLAALEAGTRLALQRANAGLAVYLAGADPWEGDRLGHLALTKEGLAQRDRLVLELCWQAKLPVAVVLAGGYASRVEDTLEIHLQTVQIAAELAARIRAQGESA
jgi:acetoin utilization deacetylase AcuC-like enzyme